jgi:hypothetical protein
MVWRGIMSRQTCLHRREAFAEVGEKGGNLVKISCIDCKLRVFAFRHHPYPTFLMRTFEAASDSALVLAELPADTPAIPG